MARSCASRLLHRFSRSCARRIAFPGRRDKHRGGRVHASERRASFGHRRAWPRCFGAPHARRRAPYRRCRCFHRRRRCRGRGSRVRRECEGQVRRCVIVPARSAAGHSFDTRSHGSCVRAWFGSGDDDRGDHGGVGTLHSSVHALARPSRGRIALCDGGAPFRRFGGEDGCARGASELGGSLGNHGGHEVHQLRLSCCDGRFSRVRPPRNGLRLGNHDTDGRHGHQPEPVGRACSHYRDCLHHHIGQSSA